MAKRIRSRKKSKQRDSDSGEAPSNFQDVVTTGATALAGLGARGLGFLGGVPGIAAGLLSIPVLSALSDLATEGITGEKEAARELAKEQSEAQKEAQRLLLEFLQGESAKADESKRRSDRAGLIGQTLGLQLQGIQTQGQGGQEAVDRALIETETPVAEVDQSNATRMAIAELRSREAEGRAGNPLLALGFDI